MARQLGAQPTAEAATELLLAARRVHAPRRKLPALQLIFEQVEQAPRLEEEHLCERNWFVPHGVTHGSQTRSEVVVHGENW